MNSSLSTGSGTAEARAVTTDAAGNSYVVGRFLGTVIFLGTTLTSTSAAQPSGFLAKFSRTGSPEFVKKVGSNSSTELLAVAVKPGSQRSPGRLSLNEMPLNRVPFKPDPK